VASFGLAVKAGFRNLAVSEKRLAAMKPIHRIKESMPCLIFPILLITAEC
jgi:hypothetical protein